MSIARHVGDFNLIEMNKESLVFNTPRVLVALVLVAGVSGQVLRTTKPKQAEASPVARPEPRVRIAGDPLVIFQNLVGSSSANRRLALDQLGWKEQEKYADDPKVIGDARFYRVNLDDDDETEAIMQLNLGVGNDTRVLIFKNSDAGWWQIGAFALCCTPRPNEAEGILELRNIIDFDHKDIIVRLAGGGTDIQRAIEFSIYRVFQGRLYRTFETTEEFALRRFPGPGKMIIEDERHQIVFPERMQGEDAYIVVRSTKELAPEAKWNRDAGNPTLISCIPYRWDPVTYSFVADKSASGKFCKAGPHLQDRVP